MPSLPPSSTWATLFGYPPDGVGWLLATVASLLPDADLPPSKIGRLLFWLSVPLERRFGHRTMTHADGGMMAVALLLRVRRTTGQRSHSVGEIRHGGIW